MPKSRMQAALDRARRDPDKMAEIHRAGAERHGGLWLRANIAAVNAANGTGLSAEAFKVPISMIVLQVLDVAKPRKEKKNADV